MNEVQQVKNQIDDCIFLYGSKLTDEFKIIKDRIGKNTNLSKYFRDFKLSLWLTRMTSYQVDNNLTKEMFVKMKSLKYNFKTNKVETI